MEIKKKLYRTRATLQGKTGAPFSSKKKPRGMKKNNEHR